MNLKFSEIVQLNNQLGQNHKGPDYNISLLANIIINQINPILEYSLRKSSIPAKCLAGEYDNIMQESAAHSDANAILIFWELANMVDGFQYLSNTITENEADEIVKKVKSEIDFVFGQLKNAELILFNKFSTLVFNHHFLKKNRFDSICEDLNDYITKVKPGNVVLIDLDKIIARISIDRSVDYRNYYSAKSLYSVEFLKEYVTFITPIFLSAKGYSKKVLVLDCDNTMWSGIVGEDGGDGIQMSKATPKGVVYNEVQSIAKDLRNKGVIVALNSKNNPQDVDEIIAGHPDMELKDDDIVIKKVNWNDKAENIKSIAKDLNVGLDSLVFVDDSDFEINLIRDLVPEIYTIQVPKERYLYPSEIRKHANLFFNINETKEDAERVNMYKQSQVRATEVDNFSSIDKYLESLNLELVIFRDQINQIARVSQLTQKTNQFNFTTKRYTESQIRNFMESEKYTVLSFQVKDKYGDFGITGVAIIEIGSQEATIDTFLMSCRVLGRKIEIKFIDEIVKYLSERGCTNIRSSYQRSFKNVQVESFFETLGFHLLEDISDGSKNYRVVTSDYQYHPVKFINVSYE